MVDDRSKTLLTAAMLACFLAAGWHFAGNDVSEAAVRSHDQVVPASLADSIQTTMSDRESPEYATRNIEDLKPGDLVLAREEHGNSIDYKPIKKVFRRTSYHLRHLTFETKDGIQQTLETTNEHPFWSVTDQAWTDAGDLKPGTEVTSPTGTIQTLTKTSRTEHPEGVPVFNFQVDDFHTYFVSEKLNGSPLLVHNANCLDDVIPDPRKSDWYDPGADHVDHIVARAFDGADDEINKRVTRAGLSLRKGGLEGSLKKYENSLIDGGMKPEDARKVIQGELDAMGRDALPTPFSSIKGLKLPTE